MGRKAGRRCRRAEDSAGKRRREREAWAKRVCRGKGEACSKMNGGKACEGFGKRGAGKLRGARGGGPKGAGGGRACPSPRRAALRRIGCRSVPVPPDSRGRSPPRGGPRTHFLTRPRPLLKGPARPASPLKPQRARNILPSQACVCVPASSPLRCAPHPGIVGRRESAPAEGSYRCLSLGPLFASPPPRPCPALSCREANCPRLRTSSAPLIPGPTAAPEPWRRPASLGVQRPPTSPPSLCWPHLTLPWCSPFLSPPFPAPPSLFQAGDDPRRSLRPEATLSRLDFNQPSRSAPHPHLGTAGSEPQGNNHAHPSGSFPLPKRLLLKPGPAASSSPGASVATPRSPPPLHWPSARAT